MSKSRLRSIERGGRPVCRNAGSFGGVLCDECGREDVRVHTFRCGECQQTVDLPACCRCGAVYEDVWDIAS
jgi:hypothetical protein